MLAEKEERVRKLFVTDQINDKGIYGVVFCDAGHKQLICVDDHYVSRQGRAIFSQNKEPEMWVMVLEKAWAKLFKSYERTNGGMTERSVMSLTGAPYAIMYSGRSSWNGVWEKMKEYDQKDYMMGACIFAHGKSDSH